MMPTFVHGKNTKVYLNGYDISTYLSSIEVSKTADVADVSTFGSTSKEYLPGIKDSVLSAEGFVDEGAATMEGVIENILSYSGLEWNWYPNGDT